jgi:cell division protein FtsL
MLKEAEMRGGKDRDAMEELKKKKIELECEVKKLNEKRVVDGKAFDVLRTMMVELENQILELKGKTTEDDKSFDELREKNGELKNEVLELQSKVRVLEDDRKGLAEIEIKNGVLKETVKDNLAMISRLKNENSSLAEEKHKGKILFESLNIKFKELHERVAKMEDDTELLMRVDASWGGKNEEGDPPGDPMVTEFGNDTVQAAPLPRNEDAQLQNIGSKDAQGASSGIWRLCISLFLLRYAFFIVTLSILLNTICVIG